MGAIGPFLVSTQKLTSCGLHPRPGSISSQERVPYRPLRLLGRVHDPRPIREDHGRSAGRGIGRPLGKPGGIRTSTPGEGEPGVLHAPGECLGGRRATGDCPDLRRRERTEDEWQLEGVDGTLRPAGLPPFPFELVDEDVGCVAGVKLGQLEGTGPEDVIGGDGQPGLDGRGVLATRSPGRAVGASTASSARGRPLGAAPGKSIAQRWIRAASSSCSSAGSRKR